MSENERVILWQNGSAIEVDRTQVEWWTDRTRQNEGKTCPRKRWIKYHEDKRGYDSTYQGEELVLGSAVHLGLEGLVLGASEDDAASAARDAVIEAKMSFEESDLIQLLGESASTVLKVEQAWLAEMLVRAFARRHLAKLLEVYEVVSVEEEVNWVLWEDKDAYHEKLGWTSSYGVMMSRPDMVLRERSSGRLYAVSYKTSKEFGKYQWQRLETDVQKLTEGWAVTERYGVDCAGVLYFYFVKGKKYGDKDLGGLKRYTSPLVRPWMRDGIIGEVGPEHFQMEWEYTDPKTGKSSRLNKGWSRVNVWEHVELSEWVEWLDQGLVNPSWNRDWLGEAVASPMVQVWDRTQAERWRVGAVESESILKLKERLAQVPSEVNVHWPLNEQACFNFGRKCMAFDVCWGAQTSATKVAMGHWQSRVSNHGQESEDE